jgi:hypothetical protein
VGSREDEDACGDVLREEELELLVGELAQLGTEHIVDADVVCIASARVAALVNSPCVHLLRSCR